MSNVTDENEYGLYWSVPSKFYAGSVIPRWKTVANRTEAIEEAHRLIESGETDRVTMRSVEVIT